MRSTYSIGGDLDITQEKKDIVKILSETENIEDLPNKFSKRCENLLNYIIFSLLSPALTDSRYDRSSNLATENEFFSNILIGVKREIDYTLKAPAAITFKDYNYVILINPFFFFQESLLIMTEILKHELYHMMFLHLSRSIPFQARFSEEELNISMDVAVNQFLPNLAKGGLTLDWFKEAFDCSDCQPKMNFEYYLEIISKSKYHQMQQQMKKMALKNFLEKINGNDSSDSQNNSDDDQQQNNSSSDSKGKTKIAKDIDSNSRHEWKVEIGEEADSEIQKNIAKTLCNTAAGKARGSLPSQISRLLSWLNTKPQLEWQDFLQRYMGSVPVPYKKTIMRRDRRQPDRLDLRGRLNDRQCHIVVAVDVSGSISDDDLKLFLRELFFITKSLKRKDIRVIQFDTQIESEVYIHNENDVKKIERKASGGTTFSPVFEYLKRNNCKEDILILFTDGYGESELSCKPKHFRTIWVLTKDGQLSVKEPYGIVRQFKKDNLKHKK